MSRVYEIIKRPVISEKAAALAEVGNRFVFEVDRKATKTEVKEAIQRLFGVRVLAVRTALMHGKWKVRGASRMKRPNWKKAIVTLPEGQKIEFFDAK